MNPFYLYCLFSCPFVPFLIFSFHFPGVYHILVHAWLHEDAWSGASRRRHSCRATRAGHVFLGPRVAPLVVGSWSPAVEEALAPATFVAEATPSTTWAAHASRIVLGPVVPYLPPPPPSTTCPPSIRAEEQCEMSGGA
jgi:hypothetical protein